MRIKSADFDQTIVCSVFSSFSSFYVLTILLDMSDDEEETSYRMRDPAKGLAGKAIIINVMNKSSEVNYRIGSGNDVQKMQEVFEHLNLEVQRAQSDDPTAQEIKDGIIRFRDTLIEEYRNREEDFDMVAVCLMGHGQEGVICGSDEKEVDLRAEVFQVFSNENCNVLSGKPRLFFIQACRGDKRDRGINGQSTLKRLATSKQFKQTINGSKLFYCLGTGELIIHYNMLDRVKERLHLMIQFELMPVWKTM